jgi:thiamine-phosphate diphosphorylase
MSQQATALIDTSLRQLREGLHMVSLQLEAEAGGSDTASKADQIHERVTFEERMLRAKYSRELLGGGMPSAPAAQRQRRTITTAANPAEVIESRLRECQEHARSLEEYLQFFGLGKAAEFYKRVRFELYDLESETRQLFADESPPASPQAPHPRPAGEQLRQALDFCPLYFIVDESLLSVRDPLKLVFDVTSGGVRVVQLRMKRLSGAGLLELAQKLKRICDDRECLLIINDRVDVALMCRASGVHLGEHDPPVHEVRRIAPDLLLGATVRNAQAAVEAQAAGADYVGCGSVFGSKTKPGLPVVGLRGLGRVAAAVELPVIGIGGITLDRCAEVMKTGAAGFCAVSPFLAKVNARNLAGDFRKAGILEAPGKY